MQLADLDNLVLVDAKAPVSFFAYPGKKSYLVPDTCTVHELASSTQDALGSLEKLVAQRRRRRHRARAAAAGTPGPSARQVHGRQGLQGRSAHLLPERAIIVDEAQTSGVMLPMLTAGAPRHDLIALTGGAIGQGLPSAVGAAVACPDRPVLALVGDGSAMYTIQALWTMAREKLNVVAVVFNNRAYSILNIELQRVGAAEAGPKAKEQLDLRNPALDFVQMGNSMGVPSVRATTTAEFVTALEHALKTPGPHLIDAVVPGTISGLKLKLLPRVLGALAGLPAPLGRAIKRKLAP